MTGAHPAGTADDAGGRDQAPAAAFGLAEWLSLAAAPTFAIMVLLTGILGGDAPSMLCGPAHDASPLSGLVSGMIPMYLLMSIFHAPPWLKLIPNVLAHEHAGG